MSARRPASPAALYEQSLCQTLTLSKRFTHWRLTWVLRELGDHAGSPHRAHQAAPRRRQPKPPSTTEGWSTSSHLCLLATALTSAPVASAAPPQSSASEDQIQGVRGEIQSNLDSFGMLGAEARVEFALGPNGFHSAEVRDELAPSVGAELLFSPFSSTWNDRSGGGADLVPSRRSSATSTWETAGRSSPTSG